MLTKLLGLLLVVNSAATGLALGADRDDDNARTIVVTGFGEVSVAPDKAIVSMAAQAVERQLDTSREKVTRVVQSFLELTHELKIADKYVQTSQLTVRPEYEWHPDTGEQRLIGYFVERQLTVDLRELENLGLLMERAVSTGVNIVSGPTFGSTEEKELNRVAIKRAAEDARANAQMLAETLGARVGLPRLLTATSQGPEPPVIPYAMAKMEMADTRDAAETYQAGRIDVTAQVSARFDLLVD